MEKLERMNILLVGNNPLKLSSVDLTIAGFGRGTVKPTFIFDLKALTRSIKLLNPSAIFMDDTLNLKEIKRAILKLRRNKNASHIPVTLMKSSNFTNYPNLGADDFILNSNLSGKGIYTSVTNGQRFRKNSYRLKKSYLAHQSKLTGFIENLKVLFY